MNTLHFVYLLDGGLTSVDRVARSSHNILCEARASTTFCCVLSKKKTCVLCDACSIKVSAVFARGLLIFGR